MIDTLYAVACVAVTVAAGMVSITSVARPGSAAPVLAVPVTPHRWSSQTGLWTCFDCGQDHPDPCSCPCCEPRQRPGGRSIAALHPVDCPQQGLRADTLMAEAGLDDDAERAR